MVAQHLLRRGLLRGGQRREGRRARSLSGGSAVRSVIRESLPWGVSTEGERRRARSDPSPALSPGASDRSQHPLAAARRSCLAGVARGDGGDGAPRIADGQLPRRRARCSAAPMPITLATWNVNSVRLREGARLRPAGDPSAPDVLCLQECKSPADLIPRERFAALGYPHLVARRARRATTASPSSRACRSRTRATSTSAARGDARHVGGAAGGRHDLAQPLRPSRRRLCPTASPTTSSPTSSTSWPSCATASAPTGPSARFSWATSTSPRARTTCGRTASSSAWSATRRSRSRPSRTRRRPAAGRT